MAPFHNRLRILDSVAAAAIVVMLVGWMLKTPVSAKGWERRDLNDYTLNLRHSREVDSSHLYPFGFTYPPPSVLLRLGFGALGFECGGGLWIALSGLSLLVSLAVILWMLGRLETPGVGVLALVALLLVKNPFEFEYKYLNSNAIFLALAVGGIALIDSRPTLAGLFLSLSIALKLYSVVFIPWLLLTRRRRATLAATAFSLIWFLAAPILVWGWTPAWEINASWFHRVQETGARDFPLQFLPYAYLVSLHSAILAMLERTPLTNPFDVAQTVTRGLQAVWTVAVISLLATDRRTRSVRATLVDASLLLLLPLPLSGQLQPHHLVVMLPASVVMTSVACSRSQTVVLRALCMIVLGAGFVVMEFGPRPPWKGLGMNSAVLLYVLGLAGVKRAAS